MAQIDTNLYTTIAYEYASIWSALLTLDDGALNSVNAIVDVTTTAYPTDGTASAAAAREIELALLSVFNGAYNNMVNMSNSTSALLEAVRAVNDHVINNSSFDGTATEKLTDFVNTDVAWYDQMVPMGWCELSSDAGYTVTLWRCGT